MKRCIVYLCIFKQIQKIDYQRFDMIRKFPEYGRTDIKSCGNNVKNQDNENL